MAENSMREPFDAYAEVRIKVSTEFPECAGKLGAIMGVSHNLETDEFFYSVSVDGLRQSYFLPETDLLPTGKLRDESQYMSGINLKVIVDTESGEGFVAPDEI